MSHKAYAFDIDDNLLHTECRVFVEIPNKKWWEKIEIAEKELKTYLSRGARFPNNDSEECFLHMRGADGKLQQQLFDAIENKARGPSRESFKYANISANPIGLITARGHPIEELKKTHQAILHEIFDITELEQLIENMNIRLQTKLKNKDQSIKLFLDLNYYAPCSDLEYLKKIELTNTSNIAERKVKAFKHFIHHIINLNQANLINQDGKKLKIWFSDDSQENITAIKKSIEKDLLLLYPDITFSIYNTNIPSYVKKTIYSKTKNYLE